MKTVAELWTSFEHLDLDHPQIGLVQKLEMKKAFYAGCLGAFHLMLEVSNPGVSEEEGCKYLDELLAECLAFQKNLNGGEEDAPDLPQETG